MPKRPLLLALALLTAAPAVPTAAAAKDLLVFAAASTTQIVRDVGAAYAAKTGQKIRTAFASSGGLARQIESGAPADVFVSANTDWTGHLIEKGAADGASRRILFRNTLALVAPSASAANLKIEPGFALRAALGPDGRLALADPRHAPAGKYAEDALTALGVWQGVADRTAMAANVRAALALVERGEVPFGIVYRTDALQTPKVRIVALFPETSHRPIRYEAVAVRKAGAPDAAGAMRFLDFMVSPEAIDIYRKYGFIAD